MSEYDGFLCEVGLPLMMTNNQGKGHVPYATSKVIKRWLKYTHVKYRWNSYSAAHYNKQTCSRSTKVGAECV